MSKVTRLGLARDAKVREACDDAAVVEIVARLACCKYDHDGDGNCHVHAAPYAAVFEANRRAQRETADAVREDNARVLRERVKRTGSVREPGPCLACGHSPDEHVDDPEYPCVAKVPGSVTCQCRAYEAL